MHACLLYPMRATCITDPFFLDWIALTTFGVEYKSRRYPSSGPAPT